MEDLSRTLAVPYFSILDNIMFQSNLILAFWID